MKTNGSAVWQGGLKDGRGAITTHSGALKDYPYGYAARFEGKPGTNPEELIGAAHAGCFTMALSMILGGAGSERYAEFAGLLRSECELRPARFAGQAGVIGAAMAAAESPA